VQEQSRPKAGKKFARFAPLGLEPFGNKRPREMIAVSPGLITKFGLL